MVQRDILAVSGSLRAASYNSALLGAAASVAAPGVTVTLYKAMHALPMFNPDLDPAQLPVVSAWRARVAAADGVLIASPEYAHGISGVMKNALDWLVSLEQFDGKPVALLNAAPRASHAHAALAEVLQTMSAQLVPGAALILPPAPRRDMDSAAILAEPALAEALRAAVAALVDALPA